MTEQWQELKETITEMRDNNGTGTQQDVCKFLANLMDVLEKQMQEPCEDAISRQAVIDTIESWLSCDGYNGAERHIMRAVQSVLYDLPSVNPQPKTGHWKRISMDKYVQHAMAYYKCSECGEDIIGEYQYCPNCGAKMEVSDGNEI